jgi:dsDNA-specific endonuclease/ATPase MutS2
MSSVDSIRSKSSPATAETRTRDREVETLKDEVKNLREAHRAEISRLQDENRKTVEQIHNESNAKLNEKDVQHQKEIEAMRAMYARKTGGQT